MKTLLLSVAALTVAALPLAARQHAPDHDKTIAGGGTLPAGWKGRLDSGGTSTAGVKMTPMGGGVHIISGPAGIYYRPADKPTGEFGATATFTQMERAEHPEAYGLFIGGANLETASQKYTYFLVRQDGKFLLKRRSGSDTPTVVDWMGSTAIRKPDSSGKMSNTLAVEVGRDRVRFLVNGTEVTSTETSKVDAAGIAGLRVNHNLNVHVEGFTVRAR